VKLKIAVTTNSMPCRITPLFIKKPLKNVAARLGSARSDSLGLDKPSRDKLYNLEATDVRLSRNKLH